MVSQLQLQLRRAMARALFDYFCPQDLDAVSCHPALLAIDADIALLRTVWQELSDHGYAENVAGYRGRYKRLGDKLRKHIEQEKGLPPDEFFFGVSAL